MSWSKRELDARIDEVLVDAYGDYEQLGSFACVLDELIERPVAASVIGEPVELLSVVEEGLSLRAKVRRAGRKWKVSLVDLRFGHGVNPDLALTVEAYRRWAHGLG